MLQPVSPFDVVKNKEPVYRGVERFHSEQLIASAARYLYSIWDSKPSGGTLRTVSKVPQHSGVVSYQGLGDSAHNPPPSLTDGYTAESEAAYALSTPPPPDLIFLKFNTHSAYV